MYYDDLDDDEKARQVDEEREQRYQEGYYLDETVDYCKEVLESIGFSDIDIRYSGFSSQGDGLSFTAKYSNVKRITKVVVDLTTSPDILDLTRKLMELQQSKRYRLIAEITAHRRWGNYVHENTVDIATSLQDWDEIDHVTYDFEWQENEAFTEIVKGLSQTFYKMLEDEYNHYVSDEGIIEYFRECEIEFEKTERIVRK